MRKIGIITLHRSYNCGSMLQAYAMQMIIRDLGYYSEIIDFSTEAQRELYDTWFKPLSIKNTVKNLMVLPHIKHIEFNNKCYEYFMKKYMCLSSAHYSKLDELNDDEYDTVVAGSDQIWNITIEDFNDAYFLPWAKKAIKIAYAPSFGARNISEYADDSNKYSQFIKQFSFLSVRENNGQKWIKDLTGIDAPVVLDPTLLLETADYEKLINNDLNLPKHYIFYYSPHYGKKINELVYRIAKKYKYPVIAFNSKQFFIKRMDAIGFRLPKYENPSAYLELIKNADLIITTSFHGTVFSSVFKKTFWIVNNGDMLKSDDRVMTMISSLGLEDRLISYEYDETIDYFASVDYSKFVIRLNGERKKSVEYLKHSIVNK